MLIRELITKLKGYPQAKSIETDLTYLDNYVERLINSSDKNITGKNAGERFSFSEKLGGIKLKLSDGINAIVDNSDAKHIANREKNNMQKSEISNIENIIKNAKYQQHIQSLQILDIMKYQLNLVKLLLLLL